MSETAELSLLEQHQKCTKAEKIAEWKEKYTLKQLRDTCTKFHVHTDGSMDRDKVCRLLYDKMEQNFLDEKAKEEAARAAGNADLANEVDPAGAREVLNPMRKPSTFRVLKANAKVYHGILKTRKFTDKKNRNMISVVTGTGQWWEFCLDDE